MLQYSSNEAIDEIQTTDDNVEVRGYVDAVQGRKIVGQNKKLHLFKFAINNGGGKRIQCLAWEEEVDRVAEIVKMDKILHIEGARAKAVPNQRFNLGNTPFELNVKSFTEISDLGMRIPDKGAAQDPEEVEIVSWEDVEESEGQRVAILGWIKFNFREVRHYNNQSNMGFGNITDGRSKLEIRLTSLTNLPDGLEKGSAVKIIGTVHKGPYLYLQVDSGADVTTTDKDPMDPAMMFNITAPPAKKPRMR